MAEQEHHTTIDESDDGFRATCGCGWSSKPSPDHRVAEFLGNRHVDAARGSP